MSDAQADNRYLEVFPGWLRTLAADARTLAQVAGGDGTPAIAKEYATAGLNYIFKSLDLIPDGVDDLGYCDDAFVLRVAASLACAAEPAVKEGPLGTLAADAILIKEFLGDVYPPLEAYVQGLRKGAARGRTVTDILSDETVLRAFLHEVGGWADSYQVPSFTRDVKTLIKLKSFLRAKLA